MISSNMYLILVNDLQMHFELGNWLVIGVCLASEIAFYVISLLLLLKDVDMFP